MFSDVSFSSEICHEWLRLAMFAERELYTFNTKPALTIGYR